MPTSRPKAPPNPPGRRTRARSRSTQTCPFPAEGPWRTTTQRPPSSGPATAPVPGRDSTITAPASPLPPRERASSHLTPISCGLKPATRTSLRQPSWLETCAAHSQARNSSTTWARRSTGWVRASTRLPSSHSSGISPRMGMLTPQDNSNQ